MIDVISSITKILLAVIMAVLLGYAWYLYNSEQVFVSKPTSVDSSHVDLPVPFYETPERIGSWYYISSDNNRTGSPLLLNEPIAGNFQITLGVECFANEPYFTIRHSRLLALEGRIDLITQFGNNHDRIFKTSWYTTEAASVSVLPIDNRNQFYNQVATVQTLTLSVGSHRATFDVEHLSVAYRNIEC